MSVQNPLQIPPIPSPTNDPRSINDTLWAIKQNLEILHGTRGAARAATLGAQTTADAMLNAALKLTVKTS